MGKVEKEEKRNGQGKEGSNKGNEVEGTRIGDTGESLKQPQVTSDSADILLQHPDDKGAKSSFLKTSRTLPGHPIFPFLGLPEVIIFIFCSSAPYLTLPRELQSPGAASLTFMGSEWSH